MTFAAGNSIRLLRGTGQTWVRLPPRKADQPSGRAGPSPLMHIGADVSERPGDAEPAQYDHSVISTTLRVDRGLFEFSRGRCVSVARVAPQRRVVVEKAHELVTLAWRHGYQPDELVQVIEQVS